MTTLPYFGSHEDAIIRAQHEADQMRRAGVLPPLPMRCNCESSYCAHAYRPCPTPADGTVRMDYVGNVCHACADVARANDGAKFIHPVEEESPS